MTITKLTMASMQLLDEGIRCPDRPHQGVAPSVNQLKAIEDEARKPLADAIIEALDVYGTMGNGEGWTLEYDVFGTLWKALTQEEKAQTGYNITLYDARMAALDRLRNG